MNTWLNLVFRWIHVIAGVMWIGHLWFFNFVNAQVAKTYDAESKKKVIPELMPRALYWFRWGALYTWVTGILLAAFVYYMGGTLLDNGSSLSVGAGTGISLGILVGGFVIYDLLWKQLAKQETVGTIISFVLVVGAAYGMSLIFSGRAMWIHVGALFGTIMAANVWMRIWPNQRRIIAAIKEGKAPDAAWPAMAGLRSKHNTYMSVPLLFFMVSNHYQNLPITDTLDVGYGNKQTGFILVAVFILVGFGITKLMFSKSGGEAPKKF